MAEDFGTVIKETFLSGLPIVVIIAIILIVVIAAIFISVWIYKKKKWNLRLEIKLARSDGQLILSDKAKGYWDSANGWIVVKRKGYKKVATHPIDPKKWLKGRDFATLIQVGPEDFIVADENSYGVVFDENDKFQKHPIALMTIIADVGKRKTWKNYTERMGKNAFTLKGWAEKHQFAISLAIVIFVIFLGFAILWMRMPSICGG
jgi:hypothetical protein